MAIEFVCPACQGTLRVGDDAAGRLVRCGNCMSTLRVPEDAPRAEPSSPPPSPPRRPRSTEPVEPSPYDDRDEHGEPRQRRRGPKKSGRSGLFWLVTIVFGLGILTCCTCGGLTLVLAKARWQKHTSPDGDFEVLYPAQLDPNIAAQAKKRLNANESIEGSMLVGRLEFYWVWHADLDPMDRNNNTDEVILKRTIESLARDSNGAIFSDNPKTLEGGYAAREVVLVMNDSETLHCLIVVANARVYIVAAGGPFVSSAGNDRIRTFHDSFKIVQGGNPWRGNGRKKN